MNASRSAVALLIGAATVTVGFGLAAPANATCNAKCQTIEKELKKSAASLESGKLTPHQTALTTTRVEQLTFWIMAYDQQRKQLYEDNLPPGVSVTGLKPDSSNPTVGIEVDGEPMATGLHDPYLKKVTIAPPPVVGLA
jgi:hypothetical protein